MRSSDQIGITWEENQLLMQQLKEKAALEYRRQHNIFEVGDKVIGSKLFDDRIFEFQYYLPELSMAVISKDGAAIGLNQLRHATPEEIKAGKRLEVKSDNGI